MKDAGSFDADLAVNMQFTVDSAGLVEMAKTVKEISKGKDLQNYWKDVESATDNAASAIKKYSKNINEKGLAENFLKQINALKALTKKENLSEIFPNMDINFDELINSAKKLAPKINSEFSSNKFEQAFKTFDLLKEKGIDLGEAFRELSEYANLVDRNFRLNRENSELKNLIGDDDIEQIKKNLKEIQKLRQEAEDTFSSFLNINKIEKTDSWGDENFSEYFTEIRNGTLSATEAIGRFKVEYGHLLENGYKSSGDSFGLDQLQAFSTKLDSIFRQVEETSNKINDILSNAVIAKSVQNLSKDTTLPDSQRSIFGNILQDEESLKSITALFQKLIDETNQTKNTEVFNTEQFTKIESLFTSIESSLSSIKGVLVDVGDGEELSPLLKNINNVETAIDKLSSSVKGIGLNMNIDFGSNKELEAKAEAKISNALQAYQKLFEHLKLSSAGGSVINTKFFDFDINQFDTPMSKLQAYVKFIKDMREEAKQMFGGQDILKIDTDDKYWNRASAAMGQVKKTFNEMKAASDTNPLENIFGKTDLSGVIEQLNTIVSKLDEISVSAKGFVETFKNGLNVNASVEEIEKLTNRVKELEDELTKIKTPTSLPSEESNILSEKKDAFPNADYTASVEKVADGFKEVKQNTEQATEVAEKYQRVLSQVGELGVDAKVSAMYQRNDGQLESVSWKAKRDDQGQILYDKDGNIDYDFNMTVISKYEQLEKIITTADNKLRDLKKSLQDTQNLNPNAPTDNIEKQIQYQENYIKLLEQTVKAISQQDEYLLYEQQIIDARAKAEKEYNLNQGTKSDISNAKQLAFEEQKRQKAIEQTNRLLNRQQITIDGIEKSYSKAANNDLDKAVNSKSDLKELGQKKNLIQFLMNGLKDEERNSSNEQEFLQVEKLIAEYKQLAKDKLKANNPSKQELGGQELDVLLANQVTQYNKLISQSEKYGDVTKEITNELKAQRDLIAEQDKNGVYVARSKKADGSELTANDYYNARDNYKINKAEFVSYEQVAKVNNAISETKSLLNSLKVPNEFKGSFSTLESEVKRLNNEFSSGKISVTEYTDSVKKAFSDYKTPIDNKVKETWDDITNSLDRYATLQKRIASNNALSTDVEEAKDLKSHIDNLKESDILPKDKLNIVDEKLQQINQTVTDLKAKLKESTLDSLQSSIDKYQKIYNQRSTYSSDFTPSEQYTKNLIGLNTAIGDLVEYKNALKNVGEVTVEQEAYLKGLVAACEKASDSFKSLSASEKGTSQIGIDKLVQRINKDLDENTNYSKRAKLGLRALRDELESANPRNLKEITSEIINIENAEIRAGRAGRSFFDTLKNSGFHQIAAQMAGMFGVYDVINVIKQAASTVTELNTQITELAKVSEQSSKQIYADFDSYADIAKEIRGTISDTIAATADWSKNGYSIPDAKQLAEISQLYKNVGDGIDIDTANESLISTLKGFQLEADQAEHIVDVFNEVSNNESISSGGIGEALQRSAASFNAASTSLEKSVSLVTATNSVLQDPEKVGNMWRTVSARLRGSETELKEMGEDTDGLVTSTSKLQALVKGITGFDIMKDKDTYKDIYDIVLGIGEKWQDLSDIDRASLLEALAGKQQSNALAAALSNIDILKRSYEEATNAEGSARKENEEYSKSIQASIDLAQAKLEQLANDTLNSNFLKGAIDAGGKLIEVLDGIVKSGNAIPTLLAAIGAGLSFKNVGEWNYISKFHSNNIICFIV